MSDPEGTPDEKATSGSGPRLDPRAIHEDKGRSFVRYWGLIDLAHQKGLRGITTTLVQAPSDLNGQVAIVHAIVVTDQGEFTGLGDASPQNVTRMMAPHLIRMAETRAKARALRDATNIGMTALEELGEGEGGDGSGQEAPVPTATIARPPSVDANAPPTADQKRALVALAKRAGVDVLPDELTYGQAAEQIRRLQRTLDSRREERAQRQGPEGTGQ